MDFFKFLPSSASTQLNFNSTQTKAEVSFFPGWCHYFHLDPATNPISYPPGAVDVTQDFVKTSSRRLQDYFRNTSRLKIY